MRRAPHPTAALRGGRAAHVLPSAAAPRTSFRRVAAHSQVLIPRAGAGSSGARRARASVKSAPSNMRLKLTGALVLKEAVVSCPGGHGTFVHYSCAGGRVARSLSAIR